MADRNGRKSDPGRGKLPRDVRGGANGLSAVLPPLLTYIFLTLGSGLLPSGHALAQIEGARVYFPVPQGTNVFSFGYGKVNQCSQTKDAGSSPWNGGLAYRGYFLPSERLDAFPVSPTAGCSAGSVIADPKSTSLNPVINAWSGSHFSDSCLGFRGGFIEPVLNPDEMVKYRRGFQPYGPAGAYLPRGQYDRSKPLNLGDKGQAVRFGVPMVMPFGNPTQPATCRWLVSGRIKRGRSRSSTVTPNPTCPWDCGKIRICFCLRVTPVPGLRSGTRSRNGFRQFTALDTAMASSACTSTFIPTPRTSCVPRNLAFPQKNVSCVASVCGNGGWWSPTCLCWPEIGTSMSVASTQAAITVPSSVYQLGLL
jgi:hypothetical protein